MFARRVPPSHGKKVKEFLWPSMGWKRTFRYLQHRLARIKDTNHSIAVGLANGAAISFVPVPGTHMITAAVLSFLLRGNIVASVVGTLIGNPLTLPPMWWLAYLVGKSTFHMFGVHVLDMPDELTLSGMLQEIETNPFRLIVPWVTGGVVLFSLSWPLFYMGFYQVVRHSKSQKSNWKLRRLHKEAHKALEPHR